MALYETRRPLHPIDPSSIARPPEARSIEDRSPAGPDGTATPHFTATDAPLYRQLSAILKEQILSGSLVAGDQLPTEAMLVEAYQVSRITVRQALKILAEEHLIRREAGRGTFVLDTRVAPEAFRLNGSMDDLMSMGQDTREKLLDRREVEAEAKDEELFGLQRGERLIRCERLRYLRNEPFSYSVSHLPLEVAEGLSSEDWEEGSIFHAAEARLGLRFRLADQTIRATLADATLARLLGTSIGSPLLAIDRLVETENGRFVARVSSRYRADVFSLNVQFEANVEDSSQEE